MDIIAQMRNKFPNPMRCERLPVTDTQYCVGGAITKTVLCMGSGFPGDTLVAHALRSYNRDLSESRAQHLAEDIIRLNDNGKFEEAWAVAARAMKDSTQPEGKEG